MADRDRETIAMERKQIVATEHKIRTMIRAGKRLDAAREELGYHTLQTAEPKRD